MHMIHCPQCHVEQIRCQMCDIQENNNLYCATCHNDWFGCVCMDDEEDFVIEPLCLRVVEFNQEYDDET